MNREDPLVGRVLDEKYRVEERLRRGGMGAVYLATHVGTSRPVALKVIAPELMTDFAVVERFKREARAAGQLCHPNVVNVTDFGFTLAGEERVAYLVMEHLSGVTLAELLAEQPRPPLPRVVEILRQACAAVEEAHRHGIVHRDLKPENIWLESRPHGGYHVKVLDFGVAKLLEEPAAEMDPIEATPDDLPPRIVDPEAPTLGGPVSRPVRDVVGTTLQDCPNGAHPPGAGITEFGTLLGTPLYMPPEQWLHRAVDARSDIYSLGVIAYQMLSGEVPFTGRSSSIAMQHCRAPPAPLDQGVPPAVAAAVMAALAKDPARRPASAGSFAAALSAGAEGTGAVLRRATVLCASHFPALLAINLRVFGPALAASALRLTDRLLVDAGVVPPQVGAVVAPICLSVHLLSMLLLQPVAAGLFAPRVLHLLLAPGDPPRRAPALLEIARCLRRTLVPTAAVVTSYVAIGWVARLPFFLVARRAGLFADDAVDFTPLEIVLHAVVELPGFVLIGLILGRYLVYPAVATMEPLGGYATLRRAAALTLPFRRAASTVVGLHIGARYVALWVFWLALAQLAHVPFLAVLDVARDSVAADVGLLLILPLQMLIWTFTCTATSIVYLDGRRAEGVALEAC